MHNSSRVLCVGVFSDEGTPLEAGVIPNTGISRDRMSAIGTVFSSVPDDFDEHRGTVHTHVHTCMYNVRVCMYACALYIHVYRECTLCVLYTCIFLYIIV